MNGKCYGQREIRWNSRKKDRLEHIHKRKDKNESTRRNRPDMGHIAGSGSRGIPTESLAGASHYASDRC